MSAMIPSGWTKTLIFIVLAPGFGFVLGFAFMVAVYWICRNMAPSRVDRHFRKLQLLSAAAYSLGHGANDAQKTMGIIAGALFAGGYITEFTIPFWVVMAAHAAISLGTLSGGWRIIHTMGSKITRLQPVGGFAAETAGAVSLFTATHSAFLSARLTPLRARSSASARRAACRPCDGALLARSCGRGS